MACESITSILERTTGNTAVFRDARLQKKSKRLVLKIAFENDPGREVRDNLLEAIREALPGVGIELELELKNAPDPATIVPFQPAEPHKEDKGNVIHGHAITSAQRTRMADLHESDSPVIVEGCLLSLEEREGFKKNRDGSTTYRVQLNLTDYSDSIYCICTFYDQKKSAKLMEALSPFVGSSERLIIRGSCRLPQYAKELQIYVNDINSAPAVLREDAAEEKRVELHLHSRMSSMDGLTNLTEAFKTAKRWGHKALAITDHGVVHAFPEAAKASKKTGVKAIYGVEGYLVPDCDLVPVSATYVVFDLETTGLKPDTCEIIELGAVKISDGRVVDRFQTFVNDGELIPSNITALTSITNDMIEGAPTTEEVLTRFKAFVDGACLVGHNSSFDMSFIYTHGGRHGIVFDEPYADTLMLSRYLTHDLKNHKLDTVCEHYHVSLENHHRAVDDAEATAMVFLHQIEDIRAQGADQIPVRRMTPEDLQKKKGRQKTNHIILLAKTQDGMKNLYRIVSYAHLDYFHTKPTIPRSLLSIYRRDIIVGSACEQGELFQAMLRAYLKEKEIASLGEAAGEKDRTELDALNARVEKLAGFYDFLEIQPLGNNEFMVREGIVQSDEDLEELNRRIVALGDRLGKPVAATGDVHFLEPYQAEYRKLIMMKMGFDDAAEQAPLYFKPTDEMLKDFAYLGEETAHRVVIDVPNAIADSCDVLKVYPDDTHTPNIPDASGELESMAWARAHEIYGDPLPEQVEARLKKELKSIIGNGFASLYLMAQRLVHKSNSDGYLVGSRGSVGSSLVATMAGITEVNALPPHYVCPNCRHSDFDVDTSVYSCGVDLPDKDCPVCGTKYKKNGFTIPFEVFLGFEGDKTPDIDLNFSGEYQPRAHKYVEEMFGVGHAFKAGTTAGLAEKKAYEVVYSYMEKTGVTLRRAEMERLAKGCMDIKVTTGQHPGGIVIVPKEDDILDFTPIAYPADKKESGIVTTHFDFHSMDERLVKLDILGHDDPTALRMLEDITGIDPRSVPLDDPDTRGIFLSPEPLGVDLKGIDCNVGSLGVPEFGTGFVRQVLEETKPRTMEEFVRIAGLTHGTDVWLNNAEPLVMKGIAKLNEVLCTRDDIMNYLIAHGMQPKFSFKVMESVRKGRGITEEWEKTMVDGGIPEWFIDSCHKIKYMFPRGHAVAYTMMSFRIAWFKVHRPEAFYAVYFTVRADAFDITLAQGGAERVKKNILDLKKQAQNAESAEKKRLGEVVIILELVYEMNLRGISLLPIDIYKSSGTRFLIEPEGIRPPFNAIPGIGANAADAMAELRGTERFLSVEDFQSRTKVGSGVIGAMESCGCFAGMPKSNQISLF